MEQRRVVLVRVTSEEQTAQLAALMTGLADDERVSLSREGAQSTLHLVTARVAEWTGRLGAAGLDHKVAISPALSEPASSAWSGLVDAIGRSPVYFDGLATLVDAEVATRMDGGTPGENAGEDCRHMDALKTHVVQGTASEITLIRDISPDTLQQAVDRAFAAANAESTAAMLEDSKTKHKCAQDCVPRYLVSFSQPQERGTTTWTTNISREWNGLYVTVDSGKISTANVWLKWTLYRVCLRPGDVGTVTTPPPQPPMKTKDQFGAPVRVQCPSYSFKSDVTTVVETWDDEISWTSESTTAVVIAHYTELEERVRAEVPGKAATEAAAALNAFAICPVGCDTAENGIYYEPMELRRAANYNQAGKIGYYHRYAVIGTIRWHAVRKCN